MTQIARMPKDQAETFATLFELRREHDPSGHFRRPSDILLWGLEKGILTVNEYELLRKLTMSGMRSP